MEKKVPGAGAGLKRTGSATLYATLLTKTRKTSALQCTCVSDVLRLFKNVVPFQIDVSQFAKRRDFRPFLL